MIAVEGKDFQGQRRFLYHYSFFFLKHGLSRGFLKDEKELGKLRKTNFSIFRVFFPLI